LNRANDGLEKRKKIAAKYALAFSHKPFIKGQSSEVEGHAYHLYILEVENRLGLYNYLRENHIFAQIHYIPCHLMPYYRQLGWDEGDRPYAETYYKHCISLPMYPTLTEDEQDIVINKIIDFYHA
jgi:dTDP-4-amino-4,6-dideoxygalactose transaminase